MTPLPMLKKMPKILEIILKIFFIGLLLQFFLQTFITYKMGWTGKFWDIIWLWKEFFILLLLGISSFFLIRKIKTESWEKTQSWLSSTGILSFTIGLVLTGAISFLLALFVQKVGLFPYILSVKYNLIGFLLFIIGAGIYWFVPGFSFKGTSRYQKLIKFSLIGGLFWWILLILMPNSLKYFGYDPYVYEGTIDAGPPAVYYTEITKGFERSQFLFERPISFWFFLIAFWPLFALGFLRRKTKWKQLLWTTLFGVVVFSTLSRAAIGVWVIQTCIIFILLHRGSLKKMLLYFWVPALALCGVAAYLFQGAFDRDHSNTGHAGLLKEGIFLGLSKPIAWWGVGYSGSASHQICIKDPDNARCQKLREINDAYKSTTPGYNPENQFVQIFMEYGLLGFLPWMFCFCWLLWISFKPINLMLIEIKKGKKADQKWLSRYSILVAFGLGLLGLAIEGLVLHSFVDRMIVYPFMLLFGLYYGRYTLANKQKDTETLPEKNYKQKKALKK